MSFQRLSEVTVMPKVITIKVGSVPWGAALHIRGRLKYNEQITVRLRNQSRPKRGECGVPGCRLLHRWDVKELKFFVHRVAFNGCVLVSYEKDYKERRTKEGL